MLVHVQTHATTRPILGIPYASRVERDMKMDINQIVSVLKQAVGLAAVVMITVAVLRAFGVHLDFVKIGGTELAAISAAAAYISR